MKKSYLQFRKDEEAQEGQQPIDQNIDGGAGNAEQSGANEQANASRGEAGVGTQPTAPAKGTGFESSTSAGGGIEPGEGLYDEQAVDNK